MMPRKGIPKSLFASCNSAQELATALQNRMASGKLSIAEMQAAKLLAQLKGWSLPSGEGNESLQQTDDVQISSSGWTLNGGDGLTREELVEALAHLAGQDRGREIKTLKLDDGTTRPIVHNCWITTPSGQLWLCPIRARTATELDELDRPRR